MARWRLIAAHYLNTDPSSEIEFKETDRNTGRQARKVYQVPTYLDPRDQSDHNYPGDIIVSNGKNAQPRDIIFLGEPTADMEPIDGEAKAISQSFVDAGKWRMMPEQGLDQNQLLIKSFMDKMDQLQVSVQPISANQVDAKAFADLQNQVKALVEQNVKLQSQLVQKRV